MTSSRFILSKLLLASSLALLGYSAYKKGHPAG